MAHIWGGGRFMLPRPEFEFLAEATAEFSARWILRVAREPASASPVNSHGASVVLQKSAPDWVRMVWCATVSHRLSHPLSYQALAPPACLLPPHDVRPGLIRA